MLMFWVTFLVRLGRGGGTISARVGMLGGSASFFRAFKVKTRIGVFAWGANTVYIPEGFTGWSF